MNEIARPQIAANEVNPISMMFDPVIADRVMAVAKTMAMGKVTVPDHLRENVGDCLAIVMQAASWRLNPFAVAQKTHLIHGRLGYEAQLVSAVVSSLGILDGRFSYEYIGDWRKIAKRPKIAKGPRGSYPEPGWREQDEEGLSLIVRAKLKGDPEVKPHELFLASVWPRNSTLWATSPQQQASYLATKQWVRRYAPDAILGVYTPDEIEQEQIVLGERIDVPSKSVADELMTAAREKKKQPEIRDTSSPTTIELTIDQPEKPARTEPPEESKKPESIPEKWPQEREGVLYDIRGIPWTEEIHAATKSCTGNGIWRKRRGVSQEFFDETESEYLEKKKAAEKQEQQVEKQDEDPVMFSEKWFNVGISQASSEDEVAEYEDVLRDTDLDPEVRAGLEGKIAARRAELRESDLPI